MAFWDRILTQKEKEYCRSRGDGIASLAGRFAAKEAVLKTLGAGLGELSFRDIEIINDAKGAPRLEVSRALSDLMQRAHLKNIELSISHSRDYAVAVAVGEERV